MLKCFVGAIAGFAFAIAAMFVSNPTYFTGRLPHMPEGSYRVFSVQPAFDSSGNSVFWITASKLRFRYFTDIGAKADVDSGEIRLYSIPRSRVIDPASFEKLPSPTQGYKIEVVAGTAMAAIH